MRSSSPAAETRMPVRIGRVSSREADRATRAMVSVKAGAGMVTIWSPPGSGSGGKSSARSVRMWKRAVPATTSTSCSAGRSSSETSPAGSWRTTSRSRRAGRTTVPGRSMVASSGTRRATSMSVARSCTDVLGGDLHAGERLHGAARRRHARDDLELREQLLRRGRQLHDDHLWIGIEVIGVVEMCTGAERAARCGRTAHNGLVDGPAESVSHVGENCRRPCGPEPRDAAAR